MSAGSRYHLYSLLIFLGGTVILLTEVRGRVGSALELRSVIAAKEELTSESLAENERGLLLREKDLASLLGGRGTEIEQSELGVVEFVHAAARRHKVDVESIVPASERKVEGHLTEIPIAIMVRGSFQGLGGFIGEIENGPFIFHVRKCELAREDATGQRLLTRIESTAVIFRGSR